MSIETINIPLEIPSSFVEAGAIELYASKYANWTSTVKQQAPDPENEGFFIFEEVENPITALDACITYIRAFVKEGYRAIMAERGAELGRQQAIQQFEQAFSSIHPESNP